MNFTIDTTTDVLNSTAGVILAAKIFDKIGLNLKSDQTLNNAEKQAILTMASLHIQGRTSFAEVDLVRKDPLIKKALDISYGYAPETVRLYLDRLAKEHGNHVLSALDMVNLNLLKRVSFTSIKTEKAHYLPVDIDVSPMDNSRTKKEGVGRTYKGMDGYAPIFSYIGSEGYMCSCELRPGTQHCQKGTPAYLEKTLAIVKKLNPADPVLLRLDSGNDAFDTLSPLMKSGHFFLVKRNLRRESRERWVDIAQSMGKREVPRAGKVVYTGVLTSAHPKAKDNDGLPDLDQVFRVTLRYSDHKGNVFLFPESDVEVYWTNLYEDPEKVIELYHDHGTSEQFHSELKTDMDVERFPSGKKAVNAIILHIAMVAFNTLRMIGQTAIGFNDELPCKHKGNRKRLRKVISDLIRIACKVVHHSGKWIVRLWDHDPWYPVFKKLYQVF